MKDYIDFENSSDLAKWFMKNIYANLGAECRTLINVGGRKEPRAMVEREAVLQAWDAMALRDEFDDIDMTEFAELSSRVRADRERCKRDFTTVNDRFTVIGGSAPAKRSHPGIGGGYPIDLPGSSGYYDENGEEEFI